MRMWMMFSLIALNPCNQDNSSPPVLNGGSINNFSGLGIQNFDFETGDLTGWSHTGTVTNSTAQAFHGTHSALLGTINVKTNVSTLFQTFIAPSFANTFGFWALRHCSGNTGFGATLKNNTTNSTITWASSCSTAGWTSYTTNNIIAGDSYTLTFTNTDNASTNDYTYVDDVEWNDLPDAGTDATTDSGSDSSIDSPAEADSFIPPPICALASDASNPYWDAMSCIPIGYYGCQCDMDCCADADGSYLPDGAIRTYGSCLWDGPDSGNLYGACE